MSMIVKVAVAAALALAALWTATAVPVAPPPAAPAPWADGAVVARRVVDTLSTEAALGQLVAAPQTAPGLDDLVRQGRVGRVVVGGGGTESHLARVRAWQRSAPLPLLLATSGGPGVGVGPDDGPPLAGASMLGAAGRPDLAFLTGKAAAMAAVALGVQAPGTPVVLGAGASPFGPVPGGPVERALVRGVREGGALPAARLADDVGLTALDGMAEAGLMEIRVVVASGADVERIGAAKRGAFTGLIEAEVDAQATRAVDAVRAGADVVVSSAPAAVYDSLRQATADGRLTAERVRASAVRVLSAKAWAGLSLAPRRRGTGDGGGRAVQIDPWRPVPAALRHRAELLLAESARSAVTVLQGERGPLPLVGDRAPGSTFVVVLDPGLDDDAGLGFVNTLGTALAPHRASYMRLGLGDADDRYRQALAASRDADLVVLAALPDGDGRLAPRHRAFAESLGDRRPIVLVAFGEPTMTAGLGDLDAVAVAYGDSEPAQRAAAAAVAGQVSVTGRLPWAVAGVGGTGDGARWRQQALRLGEPEEAGPRRPGRPSASTR